MTAITEKDLCRYLDQPKYRGTFLQSAAVFGSTAVAMGGWWYAAAMLEPSLGLLARAALTVMWGLLVLRSYMIFHDCGHSSFFQGFPTAKTVNWLTMHLSSIMCGTPTDWNVGHQLHHANVGNLDNPDYDWGETIFHTTAQFLKMSPASQRFMMMARHPLPFFVLAPALTWYFKMRLPFELRPDRKAAYRFSDKMVNLCAMAVRYKAAMHLNILDMVLAGDYLAMFLGIVLFHWQHVFVTTDQGSGYVRKAESWKIRDAAMHGSSMQTIPEWLKPFTLGIEYHHIHHFRTRIPCYMLRTVHEKAPKGMWDDITCLSYSDMWHSMFLQVWDEQESRYTTFHDVLSRQAAIAKSK